MSATKYTTRPSASTTSTLARLCTVVRRQSTEAVSSSTRSPMIAVWAAIRSTGTSGTPTTSGRARSYQITSSPPPVMVATSSPNLVRSWRLRGATESCSSPTKQQRLRGDRADGQQAGGEGRVTGTEGQPRQHRGDRQGALADGGEPPEAACAAVEEGGSRGVPGEGDGGELQQHRGEADECAPRIEAVRRAWRAVWRRAR